VALIVGGVIAAVVLVAGFLVISARGGGDDEVDAAASATSARTDDGDLRAMCADPQPPLGEPYERTPGYHGVRSYVGTEVDYEAGPVVEEWARTPVEIVACVTRTGATPVGPCQLTTNAGSAGRTFTMHATQWEAVVYDAGTGEPLTTATLAGADTSCPSVAVIKPGQSALYAQPDGLDALLRPFVEVPDASGSVPLGTADPLPDDLPAECPTPPFAVTIADGPDVRSLSVPGAIAIERDGARRGRLEVWLADFPFDGADISAKEPPFAGRGSWAVLHIDGDSHVDHETLETGEVIPRSDSPAATGSPYSVGPQVQPNAYAERKNADPAAVEVKEGQVKVLHADDAVLCLEVDLRSNLGASVTGRITATRA
jgi:hypothetical protein